MDKGVIRQTVDVVVGQVQCDEALLQTGQKYTRLNVSNATVG